MEEHGPYLPACSDGYQNEPYTADIGAAIADLPHVPTGPATLVLRGTRRQTSDVHFEADRGALVSMALRLLDGEADERKIARPVR